MARTRFLTIPRWRLLGGIALLAGLGVTASFALAGTDAAGVPGASGAASAQAAAPRKALGTAAAGPTWNELSAAQRTALEPISSLWNDLGEVRKRKWLLIARNYPTLSAPEQAKLRERMIEWVTLSRQQRDQARQNFQVIHQVPAGQRAAQWEAYQALSSDEKRRFAQKAPMQPSGLARVSVGRPVSTPRLSAVPRRHALDVNRHPRAEPISSAGASEHAAEHTETPANAMAIAPASARPPYEDEPAD